MTWFSWFKKRSDANKTHALEALEALKTALALIEEALEALKTALALIEDFRRENEELKARLSAQEVFFLKIDGVIVAYGTEAEMVEEAKNYDSDYEIIPARDANYGRSLQNG